MGYYLQAFIGRDEDLKIIEKSFEHANVIALVDHIALLPLTEELYNEINNYQKSESIDTFEFLTTETERQILQIIQHKMIAYVEAEYFGGMGNQCGIIWRDGKRIFKKLAEQDVINIILNQFGIKRSKSLDEFDIVGLGRYRNTKDWNTL
ncbi:hypothetical protein [Ohtaekwangia koreensis]|uniref:Uncharacterized protein n=1 Tax=Ohtaekwangia koreensis TaxID=688867 RepID=A0A1T5LC37_9BACT|nr:hypothetical protein [Ohtaekwangia koreensis]SKC73606.1 hypothetical protein SAMN05660236_2953 [Ohtaekwangia koreensis]